MWIVFVIKDLSQSLWQINFVIVFCYTEDSGNHQCRPFLYQWLETSRKPYPQDVFKVLT